MKKRGQAALEFLTTYGWAILVVMIMIGALAYFGVLRPRETLPDRCIISAGFECRDFQIKINDGALDDFGINIKNSIGDRITISSFNITSEGGGATSCTTPSYSDGVTWVHSEVKEITYSDCDFEAIGFKSGNKEKLYISFEYTKAGGTYSHTVNGEVFGMVE